MPIWCESQSREKAHEGKEKIIMIIVRIPNSQLQKLFSSKKNKKKQK